MHIREYKPEDMTSIIQLFQNTVRNVNIRDYTSEQIAAWAPEQMDEHKWRERTANHVIFLAEDGDEIVGFITFEPNGHIDHLFVHAGKQRSGIAAMLYLELENRARKMGLKKLFAEVSITAKPAAERGGFVVEKEQQVELRGQKLTNYVMSKELL